MTSSGNYGGRNTVAKLEIRPTRTMDGDSISCQGSNSQGPSNPPVDQVALNLKCKLLLKTFNQNSCIV